ncbi:mannan chain length control protein LmeA [Rhodococcus aerolatus]
MRTAVITLVGLLGLLVLADYGAAAHAEYQISRTLRADQGLPVDPDVRIEGPSFLVQAALGHYQRVEVHAENLVVPRLGPVTVEATLRDVTLPGLDALAGSVGTVTAGEVDSRVRIDATTLGQFFGVPDLQLSAPPANLSDGTGGSGGSGRTTDGGVVLTGTLTVPGLARAQVSVTAELSVVDTDVVVRATGFARGMPGGNYTALPAPTEAAVLDRLSRTLPVGRLPFGVPPTGVRAQGSEVVLEGKGLDVPVTRAAVEAAR